VGPEETQGAAVQVQDHRGSVPCSQPAPARMVAAIAGGLLPDRGTSARPDGWPVLRREKTMVQGRRVLVTGGAGYIGSHTAKALARAGHEPVVFDDLSNGHVEAVRWGPLVVGDVRDPAAVEACLREHRIDSVINFAGLIEVG